MNNISSESVFVVVTCSRWYRRVRIARVLKNRPEQLTAGEACFKLTLEMPWELLEPREMATTVKVAAPEVAEPKATAESE